MDLAYFLQTTNLNMLFLNLFCNNRLPRTPNDIASPLAFAIQTNAGFDHPLPLVFINSLMVDPSAPRLMLQALNLLPPYLGHLPASDNTVVWFHVTLLVVMQLKIGFCWFC